MSPYAEWIVEHLREAENALVRDVELPALRRALRSDSPHQQRRGQQHRGV